MQKLAKKAFTIAAKPVEPSLSIFAGAFAAEGLTVPILINLPAATVDYGCHAIANASTQNRLAPWTSHKGLAGQMLDLSATFAVSR